MEVALTTFCFVFTWLLLLGFSQYHLALTCWLRVSGVLVRAWILFGALLVSYGEVPPSEASALAPSANIPL